MNTQKKHKKKIERQREVEKKMLRKRMKKRAEDRKLSVEQKEKREAERVVNRHTATICYDKAGRLSDEEIRQRLDRNMEVLRALQEEYEAEQKLRAENQALVPDMQKQLQPQPLQNWGGSAGVEFNPNPDPVTETTTTPQEEPSSVGSTQTTDDFHA
jgi:hypothetical protein